MAKFCPSCGREVAETEIFCANCGTSLNGGVNPNNTNMMNNMNTVNTTTNNVNKPGSGMTIAGFVCSLVSFLCCGLLSIVGLILSIIGLKNIKSGKEDASKKWMAIVGIVLSSIGLLWFIISFFAGFFGVLTEYMYY